MEGDGGKGRREERGGRGRGRGRREKLLSDKDSTKDHQPALCIRVGFDGVVCIKNIIKSLSVREMCPEHCTTNSLG